MEMCKVLALYLPQFHETPHNNLWWGEGFTDWNAVRLGEPLFEGHRQPIVPLNENYYDLLDKQTMINQSSLAQEYGLDGFIFYHYYFGNGRMELERPAENLLKWKDILLPFCFCWANQSWVRTWSKFTGNVWGEKFEDGLDVDESDGVLVKQVYGDVDEWRKHFEYLLPFFEDDRYIRIENKPVFFVFEPLNISSIRQMMQYWNELAIENGIPGVFFIGNKVNNNELGFDAITYNEPGDGINELIRKKQIIMKSGVNCFDYEQYLDVVARTDVVRGSKTFFSIAVGYDTTLRRGKGGYCLINRSAESFKKALEKVLIKSKLYDCELMIINAWNEWGEGMYLEPDEEDQYAYLEAVHEAKDRVSSMSYDEINSIKSELQNNNDREAYLLDKYQYFSRVYSRWIDLLYNKDEFLKPILIRMGFDSVAIYGYFDMGKKLEQQLKNEGVDVRYAIDRNVGGGQGALPIYYPDAQFPEVGCIMITAYEPNEIKEVLCNKTRIPIVTLEDILEKAYEDISN